MSTPKEEKTLVIVKPDGVQRGLIGEVVRRYERVGLKLVALKMTVPTEDLVERHYLVDPQWRVKNGQKTIDTYLKKGQTPPSSDPLKVSEVTLGKLKRFMVSGPVVPMVWQGMHAAEVVRKITGGTEPLSAAIGTIRGDFTMDSFAVSDEDNRATRNVVHASGSAEEAEKEIPLWFKPEELLQYRLVGEAILYDVNLDGILE
ncbi:MAG: nucleoside-diphosphate kinase [Candidatus Jorgensenbacteria bacterium]